MKGSNLTLNNITDKQNNQHPLKVVSKDQTFNNIKFTMSGFQLKVPRYADRWDILTQNQKRDKCIEKGPQVKSDGITNMLLQICSTT